MKTWMLLVGLFAILVVPAMANTTMTEHVDVTCTIDDYVYAGIDSGGNVNILQTNMQPTGEIDPISELPVFEDTGIDGLSFDAQSEVTSVNCTTEANCNAAVSLMASPFTLGTEALKTSVTVIDEAYANGFTGFGVVFTPDAEFNDTTGTLVAGTQSIAGFSMTPAGTFDYAATNLSGARRLEWGYNVQATNQTLASPTLIALSGVYTSTWTLTITKTP